MIYLTVRNQASRVQRVSMPFQTYNHCFYFEFRHTHVSLRGEDGKNIFAISEGEIKTGRANAGSEDTKFISETAEYFLAGILDGIADG
jgi:hypothetical protein